MKKLILVPMIVLTVLLALAFVAPAAAAGLLKTVAPANTTQTVASRSALSSTTSISESQPTAAEGHAVSTAGHSNCGRFGDGFHGGKHDFTCPNRPFPARAP